MEQLKDRLQEKDLEIKKYKETLAKMQQQWEQAIDAADKDKNKKQVETLKEELKQKEALILNLKKDNQTLKLQIHAGDSDQKEIPVGENENVSKISLERIKQLEVTIRNKELYHQEQVLDLKGKLSELELKDKENKQTIEMLKKKVKTQEEEIEHLKQLAQQDAAAKAKLAMKNAQEKLKVAEDQLAKLKNEWKTEKKQLTERVQQLEKELSETANVDANTHERAVSLEMANREMQQQVKDMDMELMKLSKVRKDLYEEVDELKKERNNFKKQEQQYLGEIQDLKQKIQQLAHNNFKQAKMLEGIDPISQKEQIELISDLKNSVIMLEKELKIVSENSKREIELYKKQAAEAIKQLTNFQQSKEYVNNMDKAQQQKQRNELLQTKQELAEAVANIQKLQNELLNQEKFFKAQLQGYKDKQAVIDRVGGTEMISEAQAQLPKIKLLEKKLAKEIDDKQDLLNQITLLNNELKQQEVWFKKQLKDHQDANSSVQQSSLLNDHKFVELMTRLNQEQQRHYKEKAQFENNVKISTEIAREKVHTLEIELKKQAEYFEKQRNNHQIERQQLQEELETQKKEKAFKDKQIGLLQEEIEKLREDKKQLYISKHKQETPAKLPSMKHQPQTNSRAPSNPRPSSRSFLPEISQNKNPDSEVWFQKWNQSQKDEEARTALLDKLLVNDPLKEAVQKRKQEFLLVLHQAFESTTPGIYERAAMLISDMVEHQTASQSEVVPLNCLKKVVRCLAPKRPTEDNNYSLTRQSAALHLICKFDKWEIPWVSVHSDELGRVQGPLTLLNYVEQSQHEIYKSQAAQVLSMVVEEASLNQDLISSQAIEILGLAIKHKSITVKRHVGETLGLLLADQQVREGIKTLDLMHVVLDEFSKTQDIAYIESLLMIMMNLSSTKFLKPAMYEAGVLDSIVNNIVNGQTEEEQCYACKVAVNLQFNSEIRMRNYEKIIPYVKQTIAQNKTKVTLQCLALLKKMTEGERTSGKNALKILPTLLGLMEHESKQISETALKLIYVLAQNAPQQILPEFQQKVQGIKHCIALYLKPTSTKNQIIYAVSLLNLFAIENFVQEIHIQGRQELLRMCLHKFSDDDELIRVNSVKFMSLLLQDVVSHESIDQVTNFDFMVDDIKTIMNYDKVYGVEQDLLLFSFRIFAELAQTAKNANRNLSYGLIELAVQVLSQPEKFSKEVRIWAFILINRGCQHKINQVNINTLTAAMKASSPEFLVFLIHITNPEDPDFSFHSKFIWESVEELTGMTEELVKKDSKNKFVFQQFRDSFDLVKNLIVGTKNSLKSKAGINDSMRKVIDNIRKDKAIEEMVKEASAQALKEGK